jgi:AmmeMemoRadiSam system protein B
MIIGRIYMKIREYSLPLGWFPRNPQEVSGFLKPFKEKAGFVSRAAISPHAGWYYSGGIAAIGAASLDPDVETIVVLGGHLSASSPPLFALEDAARTPFGLLNIDNELRTKLFKLLDGKEDKFRDNTIEVLLPMIHYFLPKAQLLWLRLPASIDSYEAGKIISQTAAGLGKKINVLGSTDLTHYGVNYGFMPKGTGAAALKWVREINDANFIKAVEEGDAALVLRRAENDFSSCSVGAVLGAMGFAEAEKLGGAKLLEYGTSADVQGEVAPDSFVGYAAFAFG